MSEYTWLWLLWFAQFVAVEGQALFQHYYPGTLTAHIRQWAAFEGKPAWWRARRITLIAFLAWLFFHMCFPGMV